MAQTLGVDSNKILVRVKRMGGGFGGKETRYHVVTNPVAVAANKLVACFYWNTLNLEFYEAASIAIRLF